MRLRRAALLLTLSFLGMMAWEDVLDVPFIGSPARLVGLAAATVWGLSLLTRDRALHRRLSRFQLLQFAFVVWAGVTTFWSLRPASTAEGFMTNVQLLLMGLLIWDLLDTEKRILTALQCYILGAYVAIGGTFFNFARGETTKYLRYGPPNSDLDNSALLLALGLPAALYLITKGNRYAGGRILRVVNMLYLPSAVVAILLTGTRGALAASFPTLIYALLTFATGSRRRRIIAFAVGAVCVGLVVTYVPASSITRITSVTAAPGESGGTLNGRLDIWRESIDAWTQRPLIGVGNNAHRAAIEIGKVAHNTPVSILTETGLIGFSIALLIVREIVRAVRRMARPERRYWTAQLLVIAINMLTLTLEDRKGVWLFAMLAISAAAAADATKAAWRVTPESGSARRTPPRSPALAG